MVDIFLSYTRQNDNERRQARQIAEALESLGFAVFWDAMIPPGRDYIEYLEQQLDNAKCVIVLWSESSKKSFWVREEASSGRDRGILIPITLSKVTLPLGFRSIQTIDFSNWQGKYEESCWKQLIGSLSHLVKNPPIYRAVRVSSISPWHVVLLLDNSVSISGETAKTINESINFMLEEMKCLTMGKKTYFYLSAITFGSQARIVLEKVDTNLINDDLELVTGNEEGSDLSSALRLARNLLKRNARDSREFTPYVFVLSGSKPTSNYNEIISVATALKELELPTDSARIISLSVSKNVDVEFMGTIASSRDLSVHLDKPHKIVRFFPAIGTASNTSSGVSGIDDAIINL